MIYRARKVDSNQSEIITAIRAAGWEVFVIERPCDLLCYRRATNTWRTIEVKKANRKSGRYHPRKDQEEQNEFCVRTQTPRVTTPSEAVEALGGVTFFGGAERVVSDER